MSMHNVTNWTPRALSKFQQQVIFFIHISICFLLLTFSAATLMNCLAASSQIAGTVRTHCMSVSLTPVARFSRVSSKRPLKNLMAAEKTWIAVISFPSVDFIFTSSESRFFNKINYINYFLELSVLILCIHEIQQSVKCL